MPSIKEFLIDTATHVQESIKEEDLDPNEDNFRSLAFAWSLNTPDGPTYHRFTIEKYAGRDLIELFSVIADAEEDEVSESV